MGKIKGIFGPGLAIAQFRVGTESNKERPKDLYGVS